MLVKIADRRETLTALETKLQQLDRARSAKREELKDLECVAFHTHGCVPYASL